jgi:hypothetical protein
MCKAVWRVGALLFGLAGSCLARADIPDLDLDRLRSLDTTLQLERDAADAIRRKDAGALKRMAVGIRKTDAVVFAVLPELGRARNDNRSLALRLTACHYAGLTIRIAIVGLADGRTIARVRPTYIDTIPPVVTDQFAAHMQRCELIDRAPASVRLIGSTCLIDGRNCRESER